MTILTAERENPPLEGQSTTQNPNVNPCDGNKVAAPSTRRRARLGTDLTRP
jgi:hypothetical protein